MPSSYKLVVYVPIENADDVRMAIGSAGGGRLGNYSHCTFSSRGVGRFMPEAGANPHIGAVGTPETVEEERIEVTVDAEALGDVIAAMKKVHPYEEVAYDLYPLKTLD